MMKLLMSCIECKPRGLLMHQELAQLHQEEVRRSSKIFVRADQRVLYQDIFIIVCQGLPFQKDLKLKKGK